MKGAREMNLLNFFVFLSSLLFPMFELESYSFYDQHNEVCQDCSCGEKADGAHDYVRKYIQCGVLPRAFRYAFESPVQYGALYCHKQHKNGRQTSQRYPLFPYTEKEEGDGKRKAYFPEHAVVLLNQKKGVK